MRIYKIISIIAVSVFGVLLLSSVIATGKSNSLSFKNLNEDSIQMISDSGITEQQQEQILDIDGVSKVMYSTVHEDVNFKIGNADNVVISSGGTTISDFTANAENLQIIEGRLPSKFGEIIVSESLSKVLIDNGFITNPVGDKINTGEIYTIVGVYADNPMSTTEESVYNDGDEQSISYWSDNGFMIYGDLIDTSNISQVAAISSLNDNIVYQTKQGAKAVYNDYDEETNSGGYLLYDESVANGAVGLYDEKSDEYGDVFNMQAFIKVDSGKRDQVEEELKDMFPYSTIVDSDTTYGDLVRYNYKYAAVIIGIMIINLLIILSNREKRLSNK